MLLGSPWITSAFIHAGVLLALWVSFAPKAFDSLYMRPIWVETDRVEVGMGKPASSGRRRLPGIASVPKGMSAANELKQIAESEAAPVVPTRGRALVEYKEYEAKVKAAVFAALETPWSLQRASLQRRGVKGRVILRMVFAEDGKLLRSEIAQSSGFAQLDLLAGEAARNGGPYPAPGDLLEGQVAVILPVEFSGELQ